MLPVAVAALLGAAACDGASGAPVPRRHVVEMRAFEFYPDSLAVTPGDTVVWVNRDFVPHTATASAGGWDTGAVAAGDSALYVFTSQDGGAYLCIFHQGMQGMIEVR